jgi:hypothetical protein
MDVYTIRRGNEYLYNPHIGYFGDDPQRAIFFGSEGGAKSAIGEMSRKGHAVELVGATIIRGSFEPIEGYNAMDSVLQIGRWKKLYSILTKNHTCRVVIDYRLPRYAIGSKVTFVRKD